jgi:hypothetical protein
MPREGGCGLELTKVPLVAHPSSLLSHILKVSPNPRGPWCR